MSARTYDLNGWYEVADNPISREGIFPYSGGQIGAAAHDRDRIFRVYRPAEELKAADTIASFKLLPIINDHTMLGDGFTPAETKGVDGVIGEKVRFSDGVMRANLKIFSRALAQDIKNGKTELSCGYRCVYDFTPGEWNGQQYDAVQRQIRGNHLALVDEGRMGPEVAILDHMVFTVDAKEHMPVDEELKTMLDAIGARLDKLEAAGSTADADPDPKDPAADADPDPKEEPAADADPKDPAADADPDPKEEPAAMDAITKELKKLSARVEALTSKPVMDEAAVVQTLAKKTSLAERIATHVGTFDHASMTFGDVVAYGVKKLEIKDVPKGSEAVALDAYLQARPVPTPHTATDSRGTTPLGKSITAYASKGA